MIAPFLLASLILQSQAGAEPPRAPLSGIESLMIPDQPRSEAEHAPSAMIEEPPSPAKLELIRRYLRLTGMQRQIDNGSFLQRFAIPGGPLTQAMSSRGANVSFQDMFAIPMEALRRAYEPHRHVWQEEYERHLNWEYTEDELRQIVAFLESRAGQHFLTGEWRMNAYIGTNTEELLEQIVRQAEVDLRSFTPPR